MFEKFRVYLRALEIEDYKITFKWRQDIDIQYGFSDKRVFVSSENERKWIETIINDFSKVSLGICLKENDELIGLSFINEINMHHRTAQTGSMIGDIKFRGKGYGIEAKMLSLYHAFYDRNLNRIWTKILTDNIASIKMCERCNYKREGEFRQSRFKNGKFVNEYFYAVLKEDFIKVWNEFNEL